MLRRTTLSRVPAWVAKLQGAYNTETMRLRHAKTSKGGMQSDPIFGKQAFESTQRPMRKNRANTLDVTKDFMQGDEMHKWMDIEQAAKVLGIKEDELIGLKPARIEEAWAKLYRANRFSHGKTNEISSAAEILLGYCDSDLAHRKQSEYYRDTIEKMRLEIESELGQETAKYKEWFIRGSGFAALFGGFLIVLMVYVRTFLQENDALGVHQRLGNQVGALVSRPANVEPAPDYITRYRDTPTAIEVDRANGVDYDLTHQELSVKHDMTQADRDEDAFLLNMMNEENELAIKEAKEARQSTWSPHAAASANTQQKTDGAAAAAAKGDDVIVLPITGKVIQREVYAPTLGDVVSAADDITPMAMRGKSAYLASRGADQHAAMVRADAFAEVLKEEKENSN